MAAPAPVDRRIPGHPAFRLLYRAERRTRAR
jgi:hypothetical protein